MKYSSPEKENACSTQLARTRRSSGSVSSMNNARKMTSRVARRRANRAGVTKNMPSWPLDWAEK